MELREEVAQIKQNGMEKAAVLWETLESLPEPVAPINVFKAACSVKCAEFMTRVRNHPLSLVIMKAILEFLDDTMKIADGDTGSREEGMRVVTIFEEAIPLTEEIYADAVAYATRQHVYDGIIILAAAKMSKETEAKEAIDRLQKGVAIAMLRSILSEALSKGELDMGGFDLKPENE